MVLAGFGWLWLVVGGCGWFWLVPRFSMYASHIDYVKLSCPKMMPFVGEYINSHTPVDSSDLSEVE